MVGPVPRVEYFLDRVLVCVEAEPARPLIRLPARIALHLHVHIAIIARTGRYFSRRPTGAVLGFPHEESGLVLADLQDAYEASRAKERLADTLKEMKPKTRMPQGDNDQQGTR
jgi:hypothetical protein